MAMLPTLKSPLGKNLLTQLEFKKKLAVLPTDYHYASSQQFRLQSSSSFEFQLAT